MSDSKRNRRGNSRRPKEVRSPWLPRSVTNPVLERCHRQLFKMSREASRASRLRVVELLGRVAEHHAVRAHIVALYVVIGKDRLIPIANWGSPVGRMGKLRFSDAGIVSKAATTGESIRLGDVEASAEYVQVSTRTASAMAIPVTWDGKVVAVVLAESLKLDGMTDEGEQVIRSAVPELLFDLLVIRAARDKSHWCPWDPRVHGWDIHTPIERILHSAARDVRDAAASFSVWYPDWQEGRVFAYSTYGYDWEYQSKALRMNSSAIGMCFRDGNRETTRVSVADFKERAKAEALGIDDAYVRLAFSQAESQRPMAALNCYFRAYDEGVDPIADNDRRLALHAMDGICQLLSPFIESYRRQRSELAKAYIEDVKRQSELSGRRTRLEQWLQALLHIFGVPAGSVFLRDTRAPLLRCAASTGFYHVESSTRCFDFRRHFYDLTSLSDHETHTVAAYQSPGVAIRRNVIGSLNPDSRKPLNFVANRNHAEFIAGEQLRSLRHTERKILVCSFGGEDPCGVVRLVRGEDGRLFTQCDADLLEMVCRECAPGFRFVDADSSPIESPDVTGNYTI